MAGMMLGIMELNDELFDRITMLCEKGEELCAENKLEESIEIYTEALNLIPEPKPEWEAAVWIYTAIGNIYFTLGDYNKAQKAFHEAYKGNGSGGNPFINLRLGQCSYELLDLPLAEEFLRKAYMLDGEHIFHFENEKYLKYLKQTER